MQSWDNISEPFSGYAYEFLRFKGTSVSQVKVVWEPWCLPRHGFILWLALLRRLRTRDRLHFVDADASCVFYQDHEESHNHLFFACSWTSLLWSKVKSWLRLCRGMATISCNNPDFTHPFSRYIGNFQVIFFFIYRFHQISTKISAESPLYQEVPSYRQNHITLPILIHILIQSSWISTQLNIINTAHVIQ